MVLLLSILSFTLQLRIAQDEEDEDIYAVPPDAMQVGGGSGTLPRVTTMPGGDPTYATFGGRSSNSKGNRRMTIRLAQTELVHAKSSLVLGYVFACPVVLGE